MELEFLRHWGFSARIIDCLKDAYGERLLPLQERALREGNLLDGNSLLVNAPTSAGKTFLAEVLFLHHALQGRNAVLLVPSKALARQRWLELKQRYQPLGYQVRLSTRDHSGEDQAIRQGDFHLAIVIYEKMRALIHSQRGLGSSLGALIADELHIIYDAHRGPGIESLITELRLNPSLQVLGLSSMMNDPKAAEWLEAELLVDQARPVELRQGVLCGDSFRYREVSTGIEGEERFLLPPNDDDGEAMLNAARCFAEQGEATLLFWPRRDLCYTAARKLAEGYQAEELDELESLQALEPTAMRDLLAGLASRRIAVHTSDLSPAERAWVEQGVTSGAIVIVCATGTLAEGINIPVVNVITGRRMYASSPEDAIAGRAPEPAPIAPDRLRNMLGRAGRLGYAPFGRGIVIASNDGDVEGLMNLYTRQTPPPTSPLLSRWPLHRILLQCSLGDEQLDRERIASFLKRTLSGCWGLWPDDIDKRIDSALDKLIEAGLAQREADGIYITALGQAAASGGLSIESTRRLGAFALEGLENCEAPLVLWIVCRLREIDETYMHCPRREIQSHVWPRALFERADNDGLSLHPEFTEWLSAPTRLRDAHHQACKKALMLLDWAAGLPIVEIEKRYHCHAGAVARLGEDAAWIVFRLADIAAAYACLESSVRSLKTLGLSLQYGLPESRLHLATQIESEKLTRSQALCLEEKPEDLNTIETSGVEADQALEAQAGYNISFDEARPNHVIVNGLAIEFTRLQAQLIQRLAKDAGKCVNYDELIESLWPDSLGDRKQLSRQKNLIQKRIFHEIDHDEETFILVNKGVGLSLNAFVSVA